jgi:hypothetical protein
MLCFNELPNIALKCEPTRRFKSGEGNQLYLLLCAAAWNVPGGRGTGIQHSPGGPAPQKTGRASEPSSVPCYGSKSGLLRGLTIGSVLTRAAAEPGVAKTRCPAGRNRCAESAFMSSSANRSSAACSAKAARHWRGRIPMRRDIWACRRKSHGSPRQGHVNVHKGKLGWINLVAAKVAL